MRCVCYCFTRTTMEWVSFPQFTIIDRFVLPHGTTFTSLIGSGIFLVFFIKLKPMKKIILFCASVFCVGLVALVPKEKEYRTDYKLLIDPEGKGVYLKQASNSSIHELITMQRPQGDLGAMRAEQEKNKVVVVAYITHGGYEEDDGDYQLVIESEDGETMIAEIPAPQSAKLRNYPNLQKRFKESRQFITGHINVDDRPGRVQPIKGDRVKVKITGVVFFDEPAHGTGHSINGVELHPVLAIAAAK